MMALAASYDGLDLGEHADAAYLELLARSRTEYVQPTVLAKSLWYAEDPLLRKAVEIRDPVLGAFALYSPPMAKLRTAPKFWDVIAPLGWTSSGAVAIRSRV